MTKLSEFRAQYKRNQEVLAKYLQPVLDAGWTIVHETPREGYTDWRRKVMSFPKVYTTQSLYIALHEISHFETISDPSHRARIWTAEAEYLAEMGAQQKFRDEGIPYPVKAVINGRFYVGNTIMRERNDILTLFRGPLPQEVIDYADPVMRWADEHHDELHGAVDAYVNKVGKGMPIGPWLMKRLPNVDELLTWKPSWVEGGYKTTKPKMATKPIRLENLGDGIMVLSMDDFLSEGGPA